MLISRIDEKYNIKVADFGLSEDVYAKNYFRQDKFDNSVKLPFKWMALESLHDGIFTEKTDMVCWCHKTKCMCSTDIVCDVHAVVIWSDLLGGFHLWQKPLPCNGPSHSLEVSGGWKQTGQTQK